MSGSRRKQLWRGMIDAGGDLTRRGWRNLKRAWIDTPRPERGDFSVLEVVGDFRIADRTKMERRLQAMPRSKLKRLYDKVKRG